MSIGETLAQARRRAGLSITQVSQQTRIRETIIRGIESDDYSGCGGDFYARGDIRLIARAVGADPEPLVREYDTTVRSDEPVTAADLFRPVTPVRVRPPPRRRPWMTVAGLAALVIVGVAAYLLVLAGHHITVARPSAVIKAASGAHHRARHGTGHVPRPRAARSPYARQTVIVLTAAEDCWVEFTSPNGTYLAQAYVVAGTSKSWTFGYPVDMRVGNPGGIRLAVDGKDPLPPGTATPVTLSLGLGGSVLVVAH